MNELYEINSVRVDGELHGPRQVLVLTLGIAGEEYPQKVSFVLTSWAASSIRDSLKAAIKYPVGVEEKDAG